MIYKTHHNWISRQFPSLVRHCWLVHRKYICRKTPVPIISSHSLWNKSSAVAEMGKRLATIDMGWKLGGCCGPFCGEGELGPHLTQCRLSWGLSPYQVVCWSNSLATTDIGQKVEGLLCPFPWGRGGGSPYKTKSRPTSVPSGILIHPAIWPQYTNVTDRQDNSPEAQGEPLLLTVTQKWCEWRCEWTDKSGFIQNHSYNMLAQKSKKRSQNKDVCNKHTAVEMINLIMYSQTDYY